MLLHESKYVVGTLRLIGHEDLSLAFGLQSVAEMFAEMC